MPPITKRSLITVAAAVAFAAPLLTTPAAAATPHVTFTGTPLLNLGTVACPSTPDVGNLTVTVGATVDFINHTGKTATLTAGSWSTTVADGSSAPITFPLVQAVTVSMIPKCSLDIGNHKPMTVDVRPTASTPTPHPSASASASHQIAAATLGGGGKLGTHVQKTPGHTETVHTGVTPTPSPPSSYIGGALSGGSHSANDTLVLIAASGIICVGAIALRKLVASRAR